MVPWSADRAAQTCASIKRDPHMAYYLAVIYTLLWLSRRYIYDYLANHNLTWPSLSCRHAPCYIPLSHQGLHFPQPKTRPLMCLHVMLARRVHVARHDVCTGADGVACTKTPNGARGSSCTSQNRCCGMTQRPEPKLPCPGYPLTRTVQSCILRLTEGRFGRRRRVARSRTSSPS